MIHDIAVELGKFPDEVEARITWRGLWKWAAYFKLRAERERAALEAAKAK